MSNKRRIAVVGTNRQAETMVELFRQAPQYHLIEGLSAASSDGIDIVIETENVDLADKRMSLQRIEQLACSETVIVSSILGVSATEAASWLRDGSRLTGFEVFGDVNKTGLIELAAPLQMDSSHMELVDGLFASLSKETVGSG
ncbi:3-hydroxyacyl-CoA dehydrogenase NAD-binding domain-containing protein [Paenibacillus xerothermodurans]|uniref:3-hydroxyacyl-CoA dehydrogenase NAD-binding domain-containing protein n=1 Tax=Paenibacillus xerothermodurans TaxID=1977292 RepID=UPI001FB1D5DA|nr:3-hydroxyacyl-CoA dehydrogenase NAD-binding domain-containing protein [Paenibacillus xerothermodurans]